MRKRMWILSAVAAVLLLAVVLVGLRMTQPGEKAIAPEESVVREIMQGDALAAYAFMGGTCRVYEYGDGCLGVIRHDREEAAIDGQVEFGEKLLAAEEYHRIYGDTETYPPYSEQDKAYLDEFGGLIETRSVPTHAFPYRCFADGEGMLNVWVMSREDFDVLREYRAISRSTADGGDWGAILEEIE